MVILTQKRSDDNNNPWEKVPDMEFYPPVLGAKEHKNKKKLALAAIHIQMLLTKIKL